MSGSQKRWQGVVGFLFPFFLIAIISPLAFAGGAAVRQAVHTRLPAAVARLQPLGEMDRSQHLNLAIGLPLRNRDALNQLLQQIYDPASPNYHHYLTPEEFTARFGPSEPDYQAVMAFARANGLAVKATHPNRMLVDVNGSVGDIERALHVKMQVYKHPTEGRTFYAPAGEPSVDLVVPIVSIGGLNNYALPRPRLKHVELLAGKAAIPNAGTGPGGGYMGKDFRMAYLPDTTLDGSGQVVGLLQFDGYTASDITYYENLAGLPSMTLSNVLIDGADGLPSGSGGEVEVSLDIEMVISMATNVSKVLVYEAPNPSPFEDILNRMATDNLAKQLSCSWYQPNGTSNAVTDQIFQQMAAQGQSFFNASGDYDAYVGLIDFPGDTPYITQVGGTTLTTGAGGAYQSETVWNRDNGIGSGGGISTQYPIPWWQTNINMAANQGSTTMRNTPDVAMTAENVYVRANGVDQTVGGTSCAAPLWAGFAALINQQAAKFGKPSIGFVNPVMYAMGARSNYSAVFHDITTGDNTSSSSPTSFYAEPGYDLCTGWGTPAGQTLINQFVPPIVVTLPVSATEGDGLLAGAGQVVLPGPLPTNVVVLLSSGDPAQVSVPTSLTIPAGQTNGAFDLTILDDGVLDGTQTATVTASIPGIGTGSAGMAIFDKETAALHAVLPTPVTKGQGTVSGMVQVSAPVAADVAVALSSDTTNLIQVPGSVVIPTGQTSTVFSATILTDGRINGGQTVTVTAHVQNWTDGLATVAVLDNLNLTVKLPASAWENAGVLTNAGSVSLGGTSVVDEVISLITDKTNKLTVPSTVTIPAGSLSSTFNVTLVNNSIADGHQMVTVTASAPGFTNGLASILVLDDESPPFPANPRPANLATNVPANTNLIWSNGDFLTNQPIMNGDFETGTFTNWVETNTSTLGDWVINNGTYVPPGPGGPKPPFAGSFSALSEQSGGGTHTLYQDIAISPGAISATLSWVDQICNFATQYTNGQFFQVEIRGTNNSLLQIAFTTKPGDPLTNGWTARSFDLSAYIGQTIRIAFVESDSLSYFNVGLDNIRVLVNTPGMDPGGVITNDVYFGTNPTPGAGEFQGSTTNTSWTLPLLAPQTTYYWQIIAHRVGSATGPVWQFTTAGVDHFVWSSISSPQLVSQPVNATITARDAFNTTVTNFTGPVALSATGGSGPGVLFGEDFESGNFSSWTIGSDPVTRAVTNDTAASGTYSFTIIGGNLDNYQGIWHTLPNLNPSQVNFYVRASANTQSGGYVVLSSATSGAATTTANTAVFFFMSNSGAMGLVEDVGGFHAVPYAANRWYGISLMFNWTNKTVDYYVDGTLAIPGIPFRSASVANLAIVHLYNYNNTRAWWDDIQFLGGDLSSPLTLSPTNSGVFSGGSWSGSLTVQQPATNVFLQANDGNGHVGSSNPFDVGVANHLSINIVDSPHPVSVGANLTYTLTVVNTGPSAATGVMVTNLLPANVTFVSATSSQGTCTQNGGIVTGNLGVVPGGTNATVTIVITPPVVGVTLTNVATVTRAEADGYPGNNTATSTTPVTMPAIAIADASCLEGNVGITNMIFQVTLAVPSAQTITVNYVTADGTAMAGQDYVATNGTVTFPPGTTNQSIAVGVIGNTLVEPNKTFYVELSNPVNGTVRRGQAMGTIINDDGLPGQVDHFSWSPITSPQLVGQPFGATITALDYSNNVATNFNGTVLLEATGGQPNGFQVNFENGLQGFTIDNTFGSGNGLWHVSTGRGSDAGHSPTHSLYYGQNEGPSGGGNYDNGVANGGTVTSPPLTLPSSGPVILSFNYLMDVESTTNFDQAFVEVSTNGGASYAVVAGKGFGLTNYTGGLWVSNNVPLTQFAGQTILLRFHFDTIDGFNNDTEGWYLDDIAISGNISPPLTLSPANSGVFSKGSWSGSLTVQQPAADVFLQANDGNGHTGLSNPFNVATTNMAPVIVLQPTNQTVITGQTTMFSVGAIGTLPLSYQWTSNQINIGGATNSSLVLPNVQADQAGIYAVQVTNLFGSTPSSNALLTVVLPVTNCVTASSALVSWWAAEGNAEDAAGTNNGVLENGSYTNGEVGQAFYLNATNADVRIPASGSLDVGPGSGMTIEGWINPSVINAERVIVEWNNGSTWGAHFNISTAPGSGPFGTGPGCLYADLVDTSGNNHWLSSAAGLVQTNVYQHAALTFSRASGLATIYLNGVVVAQQNLGTNFIPQTSYNLYLGRRIVNPSQASQWAGLDEISLYNCALSSNEIAAIYQAGINGKCSTDPLTIWNQPHHRAVMLGCHALFEVIAEGSGPLTYQWRKDGFILNLQTNNTLLLTDVQTPDFGNYSVVVSDAFGSVTSTPALLSLGHPPVANPDVIQRFAAGGVRINASDLVTNDTDVDGNFLTVTSVSTNSSAGGVVGLTNNWIYYAPPAGGSTNDTFTYVVDDGGCGTDVGTVTVQIKPDSLQPLNFAADNLNNGSARVRFDGLPGSTYRVLYTDSLTPPSWQTLTSLTADNFGVCQFVDWSPTNAPARYYRAVQP
jgi:uncharacterized repeat protein (TIGR01451 family)